MEAILLRRSKSMRVVTRGNEANGAGSCAHGVEGGSLILISILTWKLWYRNIAEVRKMDTMYGYRKERGKLEAILLRRSKSMRVIMHMIRAVCPAAGRTMSNDCRGRGFLPLLVNTRCYRSPLSIRTTRVEK